MRSHPKILVIGSADLADLAAHALPDRQIVATEHSLTGVWGMGREHFENVLLSISTCDHPTRALQSLREVAPKARIVVSCDALDEPSARRALEHGADDYILEPLDMNDLRHSFQTAKKTSPTLTPTPTTDRTSPTLQELHQFSDILKHLSDGPQITLERLAKLVKKSLDAKGATIQLTPWSATAGDSTPATLEEPIRRQNELVGQIVLGPKQHGTYGPETRTRLIDMAKLIDATVQEANDHNHLRELAWTDDLSQLRNRRYFEQALDDLLSAATERHSRVTVLLFDIDDFKHYNDTYGHDTGDAVIREVSLLLRRCSRRNDIVARYGGDEFAVIFWDAEQPRITGSQHPSEPMALAERFQQAIVEHHFACLGSTAPGPVTISGGLACYPWHGKTRSELIKAADEALFAAKRTGKNQISLAGDEFGAQAD